MITKALKLCAFLCAGLLAACAERLPVAEAPVVVTGDGPVDVYAATRLTTPVPRYRGQSSFTLRTFVDPPRIGDRREVPATCQVDGDGFFSVTVLTPARIVAPNYGPTTPALLVRCEGEGLRGSAEHKVFNRTAALNEARYRIDPPGAWRGRHPWYLRFPPPPENPERDVYTFRDLSVTLR